MERLVGISLALGTVLWIALGIMGSVKKKPRISALSWLFFAAVPGAFALANGWRHWYLTALAWSVMAVGYSMRAYKIWKNSPQVAADR